ncbi:restriction endonuclease [Vibrio sp. ECSMB14106]|uniref:restriction endonuclease n=1 Tax=Vibrio sp. ECSMB14106 TaxID=1638949 RepID=UPI001E403134|nr:hypothetical protein [Vibrio sp. ECSMB14106]
MPVSGGYSYSPDFAYVVKTDSGDYLNFIIETKMLMEKIIFAKKKNEKLNTLKSCSTKLVKI